MPIKSPTKKALIALALCALVLGAFIAWDKLSHGAVSSLLRGSGSSSTGDVLTPPAPDAPAAQKKAYFDLVAGAAKKAGTLTLGPGCSPSPVVFSIALKSPFTVNNTDSVDHTLVFDKDHQYLVPHGASKSVPADFESDAGIYGYACDHATKAAGMLFVTP